MVWSVAISKTKLVFVLVLVLVLDFFPFFFVYHFDVFLFFARFITSLHYALLPMLRFHSFSLRFFLCSKKKILMIKEENSNLRVFYFLWECWLSQLSQNRLPHVIHGSFFVFVMKCSSSRMLGFSFLPSCCS